MKNNLPKCRFFLNGTEIPQNEMKVKSGELAKRIGKAVEPYLTNNPGVYQKL